MKHCQQAVFPARSLPNNGYTHYCSCPPKLQCLTSDHHDYTCHYIHVYIDTKEHHVFSCLINNKNIRQ
jgi:hypothetical protein